LGICLCPKWHQISFPKRLKCQNSRLCDNRLFVFCLYFGFRAHSLVHHYSLFRLSAGYGTDELGSRKIVRFLLSKLRPKNKNNQRHKCCGRASAGFGDTCHWFIAHFKLFKIMKNKATILLLYMSVFCCLLVSYRVIESDRIRYLFLIWNLILAWIPYLAVSQLNRNNFYLNVPVLALWLLFLPNAPYIITDFLHLSPKNGIPLWFDVSLLFSFAVTGVLLGAFSMLEVYHFLGDKLKENTLRISLWLVSVLAGFGVYIGRFQRWNSWDLFNRPFSLFRDCLRVLLQEFAEVSVFCAIFGSIIYFSFFVVRIVNSKGV
jgi:uncharacterized membrane protein